MQARASTTSATTSERRMARNALLTDKASVVLRAEATTAFLRIPAVSMSLNFWNKKFNADQFMSQLSKVNIVDYLQLHMQWQKYQKTGCLTNKLFLTLKEDHPKSMINQYKYPLLPTKKVTH